MALVEVETRGGGERARGLADAVAQRAGVAVGGATLLLDLIRPTVVEAKG